MSKFCAKSASFFYTAAVLGLVACGGQTVKPEEDVTTDVVAEPAVVVQEPVVEVKPEPAPVVEVMPQKNTDESQIAVEPIPAKEETANEAAPEPEPEKVSAPEVAAPLEAVPAEEKQSMATTHADEKPPTTPMVSAPAPEKESVPTPAGPNDFVVTVGPKEPSHPAYGKGHSMGFIVNGVSGKELVVERGKTYTFKILTNAKHDVYLSKKAIGWGGAPYASGVSGMYTYKGTMTLTVDKNTPDILYYACRNHPYMGSVIHVVDPGQKVDIKQQAAATKAAGGSVATKAAKITQSKVKQKLMFAEMMAAGQGAKRVLASQNDEAKQFVAEAKKKIKQGREKLLLDALPESLALANESLKMLSEATRLVPSDEELAQLAENYKTMLNEVEGYQKSYKANIKRMEKKGEVSDDMRMDEKKLDAMLSEADGLAKKQNYVRANKLLQQAQKTVTGALHKILDSKTIVYDLKFDSPADEYEYELKRFAGYEELIPVAIEAKKPAPGAIKLMESFLGKARKRRDEAIAKADAGDYPVAISMLLQATKTVRRALRMVGVSQ